MAAECYLVIMSEGLQQRGEVVVVDLLNVVSDCVYQAALWVLASGVLARLSAVDHLSYTYNTKRHVLYFQNTYGIHYNFKNILGTR